MSKHSNKLIALALVGACSFGAWKLGSALLSDETQGTKHAVNQLWIDHLPTDDRDMITHFVMIDHPQGQFGAIGRSSQWRHMVDVFRWKLSGNKLGLFFPQERARGEVEIETWECAGEAPAPFELCMKMTNKQGRSFMLYSREEWEINPRNVAEALADIVDDEPKLGAVLGTLDESAAEQVTAIDVGEPRDFAERPINF